MRLHPHEFIRRFLMHVLPKGFHRIRQHANEFNSLYRHMPKLKQLFPQTDHSYHNKKRAQRTGLSWGDPHARRRNGH
jgi:hypothetical protein